jgi:hypothetical protein
LEVQVRKQVKTVFWLENLLTFLDVSKDLAGSTSTSTWYFCELIFIVFFGTFPDHAQQLLWN